MDMDLSRAITKKLTADTHSIHLALRSHVQQHVAARVRTVEARAAQKEEQWTRERSEFQNQIARLLAENALLRAGGNSTKGECEQCERQKQVVMDLRAELQQCQEEAQEHQDRLEERVMRKKDRLKEYVRLLYSKDDEIATLETRCQVQSDEIALLVEKLLTALEEEVDRERSASERPESPAAELSKDDQFDDEESLNSIEDQINRLIARIGMGTVGGEASEISEGSDEAFDIEAVSAGDRAAKRRRLS